MMTASATLSGYAAPATTMNSDRASSSSPVRREPTPIGLSSKANAMTIEAILADYPDASPSLIESLGAILRRELEEDQRARRSEIALRDSREAQLRRLEAMTADDTVEAVPEAPESRPEPQRYYGDFNWSSDEGPVVANFEWGPCLFDNVESISAPTVREAKRLLFMALAEWRRLNPDVPVIDAWINNLKTEVTHEIDLAKEPPSKVRKGVWAGKSDAEVSAVISKRWVARRENAVAKADDVIREYFADNPPNDVFADIDAEIQKAIDLSQPAKIRDNARVGAVMIINNLGIGYPYNDWGKVSEKWWLMKQRQWRETECD